MVIKLYVHCIATSYINKSNNNQGRYVDRIFDVEYQRYTITYKKPSRLHDFVENSHFLSSNKKNVDFVKKKIKKVDVYFEKL